MFAKSERVKRMISGKIEKEVLDDLRFFLKERIASVKTTQSYLKAGSNNYAFNETFVTEYKNALSAVDEFQNRRQLFRSERGLK